MSRKYVLEYSQTNEELLGLSAIVSGEPAYDIPSSGSALGSDHSVRF